MEHLKKTRKELKNWKKNPEDLWYIYQNEIDKTCFQQDIAYEDFKDLTRKPTSNIIWPDKTFNTAKNYKYDGSQRGLAPMVSKFCDKKTSGSGIKNEIISSKELEKNYRNKLLQNSKK